MLKSYYLNRTVDHSGLSGTGKVADILEYPDFGVVVIWRYDTLAKVSSVSVFNSLDDLIKVHGHNGDTVLVPQELSAIEDFESLCARVDKTEDILISINNELFDIENPDDK